MSADEKPELVALDEVDDLLEAYAESRLVPRGPVLARMRAVVLAETAALSATRAAERRHIEIVEAVVPARGRFALPRFTMAHLARPAFALGFAGMLAVGTATAVTAAPPGSPFYNARVALEAVFLPTEIDARLASHEEHLEERLADAEAAAARGDMNGLAAALAAYRAEIDALLADVGDDYARLAHFQAVLEKHVAKLTALSLRLPTAVSRQNAVEHAIQASEKAVTKVKQKKEGASNKPSSPPTRPDPSKQPDRPDPPDRPAPRDVQEQPGRP